MIISFPVRVTGPSGVRSYRVTDTDLTQPDAELIRCREAANQLDWLRELAMLVLRIDPDAMDQSGE